MILDLDDVNSFVFPGGEIQVKLSEPLLNKIYSFESNITIIARIQL